MTNLSHPTRYFKGLTLIQTMTLIGTAALVAAVLLNNLK